MGTVGRIALQGNNFIGSDFTGVTGLLMIFCCRCDPSITTVRRSIRSGRGVVPAHPRTLVTSGFVLGFNFRTVE